MESSPTANRLRHEASPYLKQHASNPVDWYPWGPEALARAKAEGKPILLSVGYSACHWCHVMAHECFENPQIAKMMNEGFVNIKVDREERPDIDEIYQRVTQLITGNGGWPLTVFLTPDLRPIYGGTYFPPDDKYGRPGFPRVMLAVVDAMRNKPADTEKGAAQIVERMQLFDEVESGTSIPDRETLGIAESMLVKNFDAAHGGFGTAPKFPMVSDHQALLARYRATGKPETLQMVLFTLRKMAAGGIYDQLGGGFHRYSTDAMWLAPHFEKMLYDNALIPLLYLEAFRLTGDVTLTRVVHETIAYLLREMLSPEGGFYSAQDADSEGVEGKFFVWSLEEIQAILGADRAKAFNEVYDVTATGNWEHATILRLVKAPAAALEKQLAEDRAKLLSVREKRIKPGLDNKQIAAWNGLTMGMLAQAGALLQRADYLAAARDTAVFLQEKMTSGDELRRIYQPPTAAGKTEIRGFLDDYAYVAAGMLDLHRATGEARWALFARGLVEKILSAFLDTQGVLYLTPTGAEPLPSRPKSGYDQMLPSPAAIAVQSIWRVYVLTGESRYRDAVEKILLCYGNEMLRQPTAYAGMLSALDLYHRGETTCVISGPPSGADTMELAAAARNLLPPDEAVLVKEQADGVGRHLTEGKEAPGGGAAAFVCQGYSCMPAARTSAELRERLGIR